MKLYGIYRGDKRIKRYGLKKTFAEALAFYWRCKELALGSHRFYNSGKALDELMAAGFTIKVAKETE